MMERKKKKLKRGMKLGKRTVGRLDGHAVFSRPAFKLITSRYKEKMCIEIHKYALHGRSGVQSLGKFQFIAVRDKAR